MSTDSMSISAVGPWTDTWTSADGSARLHQGDNLTILPSLPANSVDAIVCDPPYGLEFMGKEWDHGVPGEHFWREALRVAKPGAHLLAFGGTRTFHRLTCAIEDAGWEIRDCIMWVYGSGFPKSLDVSKAIDAAAGATRELGPKRVSADGTVAHDGSGKRHDGWERPWRNDPLAVERNTRISYPATEAAKQWDGWGTALKPAWEPIIVARKPLAGTVAENVQRYGTGAMNIDGCRIEHVTVGDGNLSENPHLRTHINAGNGGNIIGHEPNRRVVVPDPAGRWPANLIHDGSDEVLGRFPQAKSGSSVSGNEPSQTGDANCYGVYDRVPFNGYADSGSAARFFYCAKASRSDRNEGCEAFEPKPLHWSSGEQNPGSFQAEGTDKTSRNFHPTVKPTELMRYLCRLVTPRNGVVLDHFCGSGSTGKAAALEGFRFIGIEISPEYFAIAKARISHVLAEKSRCPMLPGMEVA